MLEIRLLGELQLLNDGEVVELPRSKKTRALLGYLACTGKSHKRERLADLFWDASDRRASLRWSLSRLRQLPGVEQAGLLVADGDELGIQPGAVKVDTARLEASMGSGPEALSIEQLTESVELFRGPFLEGLDQPDQHAFQAWCIAQRGLWRRRQAELLATLVAKLKSEPDRAVEFALRLTQLTPDAPAAWISLLEALCAADRRSEAEEQYQVALHKLKDGGPLVVQQLRAAWGTFVAGPLAQSAQAESLAPPASDPAISQRVQFCQAADGVRLAYASVGSGPPLVKTANWMNHLEHDWKSPIWSHIARALSQDFTLLRFDQRGNGLSDWDVPHFSFEAFVSDLEAVVERAGLERFALLGISQGAASAVEYAARHPERVTRLVLYGGYVQGWRHRSAEEQKTREAMLTLIRTGWGQDNPAFRQLFSSLFMPGGNAQQFEDFNELQRVSCSAENAAKISEANAWIDISERLAKVQAPTLVLHSNRDARVPFEQGRSLAAGIPNARFVALESRNHILLPDEPAWPRFQHEVRSFLAEE